MSVQTDNVELGLRARTLRRARGYTLEEISTASDLSKGHLSRFERGEKALSVAALIRLASALDCSVATLVGEELDDADIHLVRATDRAEVSATNDEQAHSFAVLSGSYDGARGHNTLLLSVTDSGVDHELVQHGGRELLFVVSGHILLTLKEERIELRQGDYIEFSGHLPHELSNIKGLSVVLIVVLDRV